MYLCRICVYRWIPGKNLCNGEYLVRICVPSEDLVRFVCTDENWENLCNGQYLIRFFLYQWIFSKNLFTCEYIGRFFFILVNTEKICVPVNT
jgi:hypothetical protein